MFSFLAGFTDAEGSIGIYKKMAQYTLGNYDKKLLFTIHETLKTFSINTKKPSSDNRKGKLNSQGYAYKNNYWQLRLCKKTDLEHLLKKLRPYLKHPDKIKALNTSLENIELSNRRKYGE